MKKSIEHHYVAIFLLDGAVWCLAEADQRVLTRGWGSLALGLELLLHCLFLTFIIISNIAALEYEPCDNDDDDAEGDGHDPPS